MHDNENTKMQPDRTPGQFCGRMTLRNTDAAFAPKSVAASSSAQSIHCGENRVIGSVMNSVQTRIIPGNRVVVGQKPGERGVGDAQPAMRYRTRPCSQGNRSAKPG